LYFFSIGLPESALVTPWASPPPVFLFPVARDFFLRIPRHAFRPSAVFPSPPPSPHDVRSSCVYSLPSDLVQSIDSFFFPSCPFSLVLFTFVVKSQLFYRFLSPFSFGFFSFDPCSPPSRESQRGRVASAIRYLTGFLRSYA